MLIAFYIVGQGGADSTLGAILAYVPFAAPMIMPARIALGESSPFEIVASLTIGIVTVVLVGRAVSRGVPACDRAHRPPPQAARRAATGAALTLSL